MPGSVRSRLVSDLARHPAVKLPSVSMRTSSREIDAPGSLEQRRVLGLLLPNVHLQDMAGPVQVLYEASRLGGAYQLSYCGRDHK